MFSLRRTIGLNAEANDSVLSLDDGDEVEAIPIIRKTWGFLLLDRRNVGRQIYRNVLENHLSMQRLFNQTSMRDQSTLFMHMLGSVVRYLDDHRQLDAKLSELAEMHAQLNVTRHNLDEFRFSFMLAIKRYIPWTEKRDRSWRWFWKRIIDVMASFQVANDNTHFTNSLNNNDGNILHGLNLNLYAGDSNNSNTSNTSNNSNNSNNTNNINSHNSNLRRLNENDGGGIGINININVGDIDIDFNHSNHENKNMSDLQRISIMERAMHHLNTNGSHINSTNASPAVSSIGQLSAVERSAAFVRMLNHDNGTDESEEDEFEQHGLQVNNLNINVINRAVGARDVDIQALPIVEYYNVDDIDVKSNANDEKKSKKNNDNNGNDDNDNETKSESVRSRDNSQSTSNSNSSLKENEKESKDESKMQTENEKQPQNKLNTKNDKDIEKNQNQSKQNPTEKTEKKAKVNDKDKNKVKEKEREQCRICLENFQTGDQLRILPCLHKFHARPCCRIKNNENDQEKEIFWGIDQWLKINHLCPLCRVPIENPNYQNC